MSDSPEMPAAKSPRPWLGPALLASVALNLFLIALMAVPFVKGPPEGERSGHHSGMPGMYHSLKDLPREDRQAMRQAMREMTAVGRDAMLAGFAKLTPEQRRRVAQAMRDEGNRYKMRLRDRSDDGERVIIRRDAPDGETGN